MAQTTDNKKSEFIGSPMAPEDKARVMKAAKRRNQPHTKYARETLLRCVEKEERAGK